MFLLNIYFHNYLASVRNDILDFMIKIIQFSRF